MNTSPPPGHQADSEPPPAGRRNWSAASVRAALARTASVRAQSVRTTSVRTAPVRTVSVAAVAVAVIAVAVVLVAAARGGNPPGLGGPGNLARPSSISAGPVTAVDLRAAPGRLTVVGAATSRVRLTGQLHWTGRPPAVTAALDRATGVLRVSYRCAAASPCTGNYQLIMPARRPARHMSR